jgi:hypothetical protein
MEPRMSNPATVLGGLAARTGYRLWPGPGLFLLGAPRAGPALTPADPVFRSNHTHQGAMPHDSRRVPGRAE